MLTFKQLYRSILRVVISVSILGTLSFSGYSQIVNGSFEGFVPPPPGPGFAGWVTVGGPVLGPGAPAGLPGGAPATPNGAQISPAPGVLLPGAGAWVGAGIAQTFDCFTPGPPNRTCWIKFDYDYPPGPGFAYAVIEGPAGTSFFKLPNTAAGYESVQINYPLCTVITLYFLVVEPGGALTNLLLIDNVVDKCDNQSWPAQVPQNAALAVCSGPECPAVDEMITNLGNAAVPTLSEWGMILLALLILCIGGAVVWNRKYGKAVDNTIAG